MHERKGKAYRHRVTPKGLKDSDFFETPYGLVTTLLQHGEFSEEVYIREPACGNGAIVRELEKQGKKVIDSDINTGTDFFKNPITEMSVIPIITNPPFSLFDEFVLKAQKVSAKFAFIVPINYFGAYQRVEKGVWKYLKHLYIFNRQVDYRGPIYEDGSFHVGGMVSGWGVWDMTWQENYWKTSIMDVQKYATRGQFKK